MNAVTKTESSALAVHSASSYALLMDPSSLERLERIADLMASGKTTIPQHLRGSKGDCFAVVLQSMQWGMNPIAVAQKTHLVNGTLGYEAQLVAAVINSSGVVKDRFSFEWFGDWTKIVGRFKEVESRTKKDDNGNPKKYIVPAWKQEDEHGLGVRVWATLKGESQPRVLELLLTQARTRNSTLWTEDPKQQLAYLAEKRWSRLYAPDVILGVYTADELAEPGERFMGMADEVGAPPAQPAAYSDEQFATLLPDWRLAIAAGKASATSVIAKIKTKGAISDEQAKAIEAPITAAELAEAVKKFPPKTAPAAETVTDVQPKGEAGAPAPIFAEVSDRLHKAADLDALNVAADLISAVQDEQQRTELTAIYEQRKFALEAE